MQRASGQSPIVAPLLIGLLLLAIAGRGLAAPAADEPILQDHYAAGATLDVHREVLGDLGVAGGEVTVDGRVAADLFAAGGWITLRGPIGDDLRVAGGRVELHGRVGDHAAIAGGSVELGPDAEIGGRAWIAGGTVRVAGRVRGALEIAGDEVVLAGRFGGPIHITAEDVRIAPGARIAGDIVHRTPRPATVAPGARIDGDVVFHRRPDPGGPAVADDGHALLGLALFVAALVIVGMALRLGCPRLLARAQGTLRDEPLLAVGIGALLLLIGPLVAAGLCLFVVTIPLALAGLLLLPPLALAGYLVAAGTLAETGAARFAPRTRAGPGRHAVALSLVLIALGLLQAVPVLGMLIILAASLAGSGAAVIALRRGVPASTT